MLVKAVHNMHVQSGLQFSVFRFLYTAAAAVGHLWTRIGDCFDQAFILGIVLHALPS